MTDLTTDMLRAIATEVVANFKTNGIPLTEGLVIKSESLQLNPEQIKRAVEVTNQIAHLSMLADATDKTVEFDLANYDDVLAALVAGLGLTEGTDVDVGIEKVASAKIKLGILDRVSDILNAEPALIKSASAEASESVPILSGAARHDAEMSLQKELFAGLSRLESMRTEGETIEYNLVKAANLLRTSIQKTPEGEELFIKKAAQVTGNVVNTDYHALCNLALGHVKQANATHFREFEDSELIQVKSLHDMYRKAAAHNKECLELETSLTKAAEYYSKHILGLEKMAFFAPLMKGLKAAGGVLKGNAEAAGASVGGIGKKVMKAGTTAMAGAEVAEIAQRARPKQDVWQSLHG